MWDEEFDSVNNSISKFVIMLIIAAAFVVAVFVTNVNAAQTDEFILAPTIRNIAFDGADADKISGFYTMPKGKFWWGTENGKYHTIQSYAAKHKCDIQRIDVNYFRNTIINYFLNIRDYKRLT